MSDSGEAFEVLECFLLEDLNNNLIYDEDNWDIAWNDDTNYFVVWDRNEKKPYHFLLSIEDCWWDSTEVEKDMGWHDE